MEEIAIVQPRMVVVMGERALETLGDVGVPLARPLEREARPRCSR